MAFKISQLAKDLGIKSKEITDVLAAAGSEVKSTSKVLTPAEFDRVFEALTRQKQVKDIDGYLFGDTYIPTKAPEKKPEPPKQPESEPVKQETAPEVKSAPATAPAPAPAKTPEPEKKQAPSEKPAPAPRAYTLAKMFGLHWLCHTSVCPRTGTPFSFAQVRSSSAAGSVL